MPNHIREEESQSKIGPVGHVLVLTLLVVLIIIFVGCILPGLAWLMGKKDSQVHAICIALALLFLINTLVNGVGYIASREGFGCSGGCPYSK